MNPFASSQSLARLAPPFAVRLFLRFVLRGLCLCVCVGVAVACALAIAEPAAHAQVIEATNTPHARTVPAGRILVFAGFQEIVHVSGAAFAPFSQKKAFGEADLSALVRVFRDDRVAVYTGASVGWGLSDASARSASSHLETFRAEVGGLGLYALHPLLVGTARLNLGALSRSATLSGEAEGAFSQKVWSPVATATAGLALRIAGANVDFLLGIEGGYRYTPARRLVLSGPEGPAAQTLEAIDLGPLSLGGPLVSGHLGLVF